MFLNVSKKEKMIKNKLISIILTSAFGILFSLNLFAAEPLVSVKWLNDNLTNNELVVLDIRNKIDGGSKEAFEVGHIPQAVYSNYLTEGWRTTVDGIVGKLPPVNDLEILIGGLGISNDSQVIVVPGGVSSSDFGSASRVYWTFKVLGHNNVSILEVVILLGYSSYHPNLKLVQAILKQQYLKPTSSPSIWLQQKMWSRL